MRIRKQIKRIVPTIGLLMTASSVLACPVCDTETGRQVREGIFGPDFYKNVMITVAPFPVVLGLIALAFRMVPDTRKTVDERNQIEHQSI